MDQVKTRNLLPSTSNMFVNCCVGIIFDNLVLDSRKQLLNMEKKRDVSINECQEGCAQFIDTSARKKNSKTDHQSCNLDYTRFNAWTKYFAQVTLTITVFYYSNYVYYYYFLPVIFCHHVTPTVTARFLRTRISFLTFLHPD